MQLYRKGIVYILSVAGIIIGILIFGALVLIHEGGHFWAARRCDVYVKEFALGLGPTIFKFGKGETKYSLKALPFGGACIMEGEDEDSVSDRAFVNKNVWQKILIVASGPLFNLLTAFVLSVVIIAWFGSSESYLAGVQEGSAAQEAGLQEGDRIVKLNNKNIRLFKEISTYVQFHTGESIRVVYERDGERYTTYVTPRLYDDGYYYMGFLGNTREKKGPLWTLKCSCYEMRYWICTTYESLYELISGNLGIRDMSGPVGIVSVIDDTYQSSKTDGTKYVIANMINIAIILSANLGIMNLLPLPALDGGRLFFLLIELITRKRVPTEIEGKVHFVGLMLLFALMIVIMFNDVRNLF